MRALPLVLFFIAHSAQAQARAAEGPLAATVRSIQEDTYHEPCDEKFRSVQEEVAAALDARAAAIEAYGSAASAPAPARGRSSASSVKPLGKTFVAEEVGPFTPAKEAWVTTTNSWADIKAFFEAMKQEPVNENWVNLNGWVRGVLTDDMNRVKNGVVFAFDETSGSAIEALRPAVEACWKADACEQISLNSAQAQALASQPFYAELFVRANKAITREERRGRISEIGMRLRQDYAQYAFVKSPHMRATAPGRYEVDLDAGDFADAKAAVKAYIEAVWKTETRSITVVFKDRAQFPDLFRLELQPGVGGRSYVDYERRAVMLFPGVRSRAIAHEVGHVLGFPDVYFTIWDGETCTYGVRKNKQDLMSDPNSGAVLPAHWAELEKQYPFK